MKEKELKEALIKEENKIIRNTLLFCGTHDIEFSRMHNKIIRNALRTFYADAIYPHLRELNINAPRKYEE